MASGHVNRAHRGRTHGRTDQYCRREEIPCQPGAVHTWPIADFALCRYLVGYAQQSRHRALGPID
jgi:hypothetical protein